MCFYAIYVKNKNKTSFYPIFARLVLFLFFPPIKAISPI